LTKSPPAAHSEEPSLDKKRKRIEELFSSSTSAPKNVVGEASAVDDDVEIFDLLDSLVFAALNAYLLFVFFLSIHAKCLLFVPFLVTMRTQKGMLPLLPSSMLLLPMSRPLKRLLWW
jgi:hypothetical protein